MSNRLRTTLFATAVLAYIAVCWVAAFYITSWAYGKLGVAPPELLRQVLTAAVGFVLWGQTMAIVGRFMQPHQMEKQMIDAIRRMSKGEFNVSVVNRFGPGRGVLAELVDSINHMAVELGQMEKMRQEFISNVSHEIQSPLASIGGFAHALLHEELSPEERRRYLSIIQTESKRLSKLSDNLLKLTSLESEHHPFEPKPYRLDKQLRGLILLAEPQWTEKNIEMTADLDEVTVEADEELMSQVWINLIHNSIKFTPGGGSVHIRLRPGWSGGAEVSIADTGIGIPEEDQIHMFERFFKADRSRTRSAGGSGLGLAIVKNIVDKHQGTIRVSSMPGEGTTMTVMLPGNEAAWGMSSDG